MAFNEITDGDSGLSARTELNSIITYLNALGLQLQFSTDNATWHYPWASGDLYMRLSDDFGTTWSDGIYLNYSASGASGWTSATWDDTTGNLSFLKDTVVDLIVNLDGRYALATDAKQVIYEMELPAVEDVGDRITGATLPSGWSLSSSGVDLIVTHNLTRRVMDVKIFTLEGTEEQQLRNTASDNGIITTDSNTLKIQSFSTVVKVLKVYISFV